MSEGRIASASAAADVRGSCTGHGAVDALCAARAELEHDSALGSAANSVRLGRDKTLMIYLKQNVGLDKLSLNCRCAHDHKRLTRKHGRSLRNRPDIALELEIAQILKELLGEHFPAAQILYILVVKVQVLDIFDHLLKSGSDGKAAVIGILTVKNIEIGDLIAHAVVEISVAHSELIVIAQHGQVKLSVSHISLRDPYVKGMLIIPIVYNIFNFMQPLIILKRALRTVQSARNIKIFRLRRPALRPRSLPRRSR